MTLRAILLDFDGVLADTEPLHFGLFRDLLKEEGITLTKKSYDEKYLGLDDRSCFEAVFGHEGRPLPREKREGLVRLKNGRMLALLARQAPLLPGAVSFVREAGSSFFLTIVSGALRTEIEAVFKSAGLAQSIREIISADDVSAGKPSPEGFLQAIRLLNRDCIPESELLLPAECLAVEDSPWGIEAASRAGVRCAALTTSYPAFKLRGADWIFRNLGEVDLKKIQAAF